jgi:predicted AAA+ superfamily ATPase
MSTASLRRVYEFAREVLELIDYVAIKWGYIRSRYGDIIELLDGGDKFREFIDRLDDVEAGRLLKVLTRMLAITRKVMRLTKLGDRELQKLQERG